MIKVHMINYLDKTTKAIETNATFSPSNIFAEVEPYVPFKVGELRLKDEAERKAKEAAKENNTQTTKQAD